MGAIIIGGARYLTSAGNPSAVDEANHIISSAIFGLLLALTSWVIISEINPDVLILKNPSMTAPSIYGGLAKTSNNFNCVGAKFQALAVTDDTPCTCIDNKEVSAAPLGATATKMTLTLNPANPSNALHTTFYAYNNVAQSFALEKRSRSFQSIFDSYSMISKYQ